MKLSINLIALAGMSFISFFWGAVGAGVSIFFLVLAYAIEKYFARPASIE